MTDWILGKQVGIVKDNVEIFSFEVPFTLTNKEKLNDNDFNFLYVEFQVLMEYLGREVW